MKTLSLTTGSPGSHIGARAMMKKCLTVLAVVGVAGLVPSLASAFRGNLVTCIPTTGVRSVAKIKPGFTCSDTKNTITVSVGPKTGNTLDGCAANPAAPWNTWEANKIGSKIAASDAALISKAAVSFTSTTFGSCNLSGDATSYTPSGTGTVQFLDGSFNKVKNGTATFYGRSAGDLPTQSSQILGIITKGFGVGAEILLRSGIDLPLNYALIGCNLGLICPPDDFGSQANAKCTGPHTPSACCGGGFGESGCGCTSAGAPFSCCTGPGTGTCFPPISTLALITDPNSILSIDFADNADCTASGVPYQCCTGTGTGTCF